MGDNIAEAQQWMGSRRTTTANAQQAPVAGSPNGVGGGSSRQAESPEWETGEGDPIPLEDRSFGGRHPWLVAHRYESIIFARLGSRVRTALRKVGCSTWGDLAELSDKDLRAVSGVGERAISSFHRDLERGPPNQWATAIGASVSGVAMGEKYGWMYDAADERIDELLFDTRTRNALLRCGMRTWGDLAALSDLSLLGIRNLGVRSVRHINEALAAHASKASSRSAEDVNTVAAASVSECDRVAGTALVDLEVSAEWASIVADDGTLGELLAAAGSGAEVPDGVAQEIDALLAVPISRLSGRIVTPLGEHVEELLSGAGDPELLAARECVRVRPTLEVLGKERNLTRERIRQKVAEDAELVFGLLEGEQFRAVRWSAERLQGEFGLVVPAESEVVLRWKSRLGERRFEMLRWASGYVYKDGWLLRGRSALNHLESALGEAVGDEWLVEAESLVASLDVPVRAEVALSLLLDSGVWRDIGEGWLVRWDGPIQTKAERVLRLTGMPMTPAELIEKIGHGSIVSLKNQRGTTLIRIDKDFRLALAEWGYEEYEGITTEIRQRIDRGGGVASVSEIIEEFIPAFGVKEGSVRAYLEAGPYLTSGDEVRHLTDLSYTPNNVYGRRHAIQIGGNWGQIFTVSEDNLNGYSFNMDRDIAAHNGLRPDDSLEVPATHADTFIGEASLIWRTTNLNRTVDVGRLSSVLKELGIGVGDEVIIVATPESCAVLRAGEIPQERRSAVSDDMWRSLLGRK